MYIQFSIDKIKCYIYLKGYIQVDIMFYGFKDVRIQMLVLLLDSFELFDGISIIYGGLFIIFNESLL